MRRAGARPTWMGPAPTVRGITVLAGGFTLGVAVGWGQPWPWVWPWLALAALAVVGVLWGRHIRATVLIMIGLAALGLGAARATIQQQYVEPDDLAAMIGDEPQLVRLRGAAMASPEVRQRAAGSLGLFDYRGPVTYFPIEVHALVGREGDEQPIRGRVLVRLDEPLESLRPGDVVRAMGFVARPRPPHNLGEFDYRRHAATLGQAGVLSVESAALVTIQPRDEPGVAYQLQRWHEALRRRALGWLLRDLPDSRASSTDALLADLLLGQRDRQIDGIEEAFRRVGLSHLLAISGAHLAVLAGAMLALLRWRGRQRRWHALAVIAAVVLYLAMIDIRVPVARSAIMILAGSLGLLLSRRLLAAGLLELSAVLVLLWRPDQLLTPGFQLTYGAVLGLIYLAPVIREQWFGPPDALAGSAAAMLGQWLRTAAAMSVAAWAVATPLQIFHFGTISPLGVPLTLLVMPLVSALLLVGLAKMLLSAALGGAAAAVGAALAGAAWVVVRAVELADTLPGASIHVPFASAWWTGAALGWVASWPLVRSRRQRRLWQIAGCALPVWLLWPLAPIGRPALRVDMISVNDGSCYLLRSGGSAVIFDAGSSPDLDVGRKTIVPALRRLGVLGIDAVIISHADIDHYASVIELADALGVRQVLVSPQFLDEAGGDPTGPPATLLGELARRGITVTTVSAGAQRTFGPSQWTWLHPPADAEFVRTNDTSMVIRVEAAGRRVLLCGDIQRGAMETMDRHGVDVRADVMELPHHGSHSPAAARFVQRADPGIILQSTGLRRWRNDRWTDLPVDARRLVTARDGACWVSIDHHGEIGAGTFLPAGPAMAASDRLDSSTPDDDS